jgi:hypothetical protein
LGILYIDPQKERMVSPVGGGSNDGASVGVFNGVFDGALLVVGVSEGALVRGFDLG